MNKITFEDIKVGIDKGVVRFIIDPNNDHGTVCAIGDNWFYFGGLTAEEENPDEYIKNVPMDTIIQDILNVLNDFKENFVDEYLYYYFYLEEHGIVNQKRV